MRVSMVVSNGTIDLNPRAVVRTGSVADIDPVLSGNFFYRPGRWKETAGAFGRWTPGLPGETNPIVSFMVLPPDLGMGQDPWMVIGFAWVAEDHDVDFMSAEIGHDLTESARQAYGRDTHERLVALKNRYDPHNLFRRNHNIAPSPA